MCHLALILPNGLTTFSIALRGRQDQGYVGKLKDGGAGDILCDSIPAVKRWKICAARKT